MTFLGMNLNETEEKLITSVIVDIANGEPITEEMVLHRLLNMAESYNKCEQAKRTIRKGLHNVHQKRSCKEYDFANGTYAKGFCDCAELIQEVLN